MLYCHGQLCPARALGPVAGTTPPSRPIPHTCPPWEPCSFSSVGKMLWATANPAARAHRTSEQTLKRKKQSDLRQMYTKYTRAVFTTTLRCYTSQTLSLLSYFLGRQILYTRNSTKRFERLQNSAEIRSVKRFDIVPCKRWLNWER